MFPTHRCRRYDTSAPLSVATHFEKQRKSLHQIAVQGAAVSNSVAHGASAALGGGAHTFVSAMIGLSYIWGGASHYPES